jgi:uncharacterized protein (TIGR00369 family)
VSTEAERIGIQAVGNGSALAELFGYRVIEVGEGSCLVEWRPAKPFVNNIGAVWGGAVSAIADNVCGMAVVAAIDPKPLHLPTVSMHVDYLRGLAPNSTYLVRGVTLRVGGRLAVADATVTDAEKTLYARATCTFAIRR